jgi:hypothetical protein
MPNTDEKHYNLLKLVNLLGIQVKFICSNVMCHSHLKQLHALLQGLIRPPNNIIKSNKDLEVWNFCPKY